MRAWGLRAVAAAGGALAFAALLTFASGSPAPAQPASRTAGVHTGVASCAGSTCHGRQEATGAVVRQNELMTWQDESSPAGAHARAYRALLEPRSQIIAQRLGFGPAQDAPECLSCHADFPPAARRGPRFDLSEGVGCEACHGGSSDWLASHTAVGASHADNVAKGMLALDRVGTRAAVCLDCHFGGDGDQFVTHRLMAAGHPRIAFELDLFTSLQRHHDEDADYRERGKAVSGPAQTWAVGQAMAVDRALTLYARRGTDGVFPEFYFLDCRTCHRSFSDSPAFRATWQPNPERPLPSGLPSFNDENMIMLSAAARVAAPELAARFDRDARAFHASFARDRAANVAAAQTLAGTTRQLAGRFEAAGFGKAQTVAMLGQVLNGASARYTDYQGGAQAVMAIDTLLGALAAQGEGRAVAAMRGDVDRAYALVRDPNAWKPAEFRAALARIDTAVKRMR